MENYLREEVWKLIDKKTDGVLEVFEDTDLEEAAFRFVGELSSTVEEIAILKQLQILTEEYACALYSTEEEDVTASHMSTSYDHYNITEDEKMELHQYLKEQGQTSRSHNEARRAVKEKYRDALLEFCLSLYANDEVINFELIKDREKIEDKIKSEIDTEFVKRL